MQASCIYACIHTYTYIYTWALLPPRERASAGCAARSAHTNAVGARLGAEVRMTSRSIRVVLTVYLLHKTQYTENFYSIYGELFRTCA